MDLRAAVFLRVYPNNIPGISMYLHHSRKYVYSLGSFALNVRPGGTWTRQISRLFRAKSTSEAEGDQVNHTGMV